MTPADWARWGADAALEATVVGSFSRGGIRARRALFDWDSEPPVDLSGRVALVTGATGGIGLAAAQVLAVRQADVWLLGRDADRTAAARRHVLEASPNAHVATVIADLGSLDDVARGADVVMRETPRLDVLVHNAGALTHDVQYTEDGIEVTAQVHVVAPFLLTTRLLPVLRATPGARVLTVASGGMYTQRLDLGLLASPPVPFDGMRAYANAKRAQVVLNQRWARHPSAAGLTFLALHPGWADTPGVAASLPRFRSVMRSLLRSPAEGADTAVWLAGAPIPPDANGTFWHDRRRRATNRVPWTRTPERAAKQLWTWCAERAGVADALDGTR